MKRFRFSLQRVLEVRKQREQQALVDLAACRKRRVQQAEHLAALQGRCVEVECLLRDEVCNACVPDRVEMLFAYLLRLTQSIERERYTLAMMDQEVEVARERWLSARRGREAIDSLRETRRLTHRRALRKQEGHRLDEFASTVFQAARGNSRGGHCGEQEAG